MVWGGRDRGTQKERRHCLGTETTITNGGGSVSVSVEMPAWVGKYI